MNVSQSEAPIEPVLKLETPKSLFRCDTSLQQDRVMKAPELAVAHYDLRYFFSSILSSIFRNSQLPVQLVMENLSWR